MGEVINLDKYREKKKQNEHRSVYETLLKEPRKIREDFATGEEYLNYINSLFNSFGALGIEPNKDDIKEEALAQIEQATEMLIKYARPINLVDLMRNKILENLKKLRYLQVR